MWSLSVRSLDNHGGQMLGEALKTNKTLRRLVLKHGGIGGQAALALSHALRINQSLRILEVSLPMIPVVNDYHRRPDCVLIYPTSVQTLPAHVDSSSSPMSAWIIRLV